MIKSRDPNPPGEGTGQVIPEGPVRGVDPIDVIGNKAYNVRMVTYETLQADRRQFLALTGLMLREFQRLLSAFPTAYQRVYPASQTTEAQPRQRAAGGGRKGRLQRPEDRLLFILVYLK